MSNFLLELMSEEMPASLIESSAKNIEQLFCNNFKKNSLTFDSSNIYYGPKRLTFIFYNLKNIVDEILIKGPSIKAPTQAIEGFAKSQKVPLNMLNVEKTSKGNYYVFNKKITNSDTVTTLQKIIEMSLAKIAWMSRHTSSWWFWRKRG